MKLVDRETLLKEREAKKALDAEKSAEKERKRLEAAAAQSAKDAQRKIDPKEMFLSETEKYSAFDENVRTICYISFKFNELRDIIDKYKRTKTKA